MTASPAARLPQEPGTFVALMAMLLRYPRLLFALPIAFAVTAALAAVVRGPRYAARAELKPQATQNQLGNFMGLAAQLGVNLGNMNSEGPEFYAAVLRSNEILGDVVRAPFRFSNRGLADAAGDSVQGTLLDIWEIGGATDQVRMARGIRKLRAAIAARPNLATGLVRFEVTMRWPELAVLVNRRFLHALDSFNLETRQRQAALQRQFIEERLAQMRADLTAAENALVAFESRNRMGQTPDLAVERQRIQRRVDVSQQVYLTLAQGYEQARIDEVRDTPVITVVDAPENTVEQSGGLLLYLVIGGFVGLLVGLGLIFLTEVWVRQLAYHPHDAMALRSAWAIVPRRLLKGSHGGGTEPAP